MKRILCALSLVVVCLGFVRPSQADTFLSSDTYSLTTNAASRTIIVTNFSGAAAGNLEWYPTSIFLNNRGGTTGQVLKVSLVRTGVTSIMVTNGAFSITNQLGVIQTESTANTNWIPVGTWFVTPPKDFLLIETTCTNGELILTREARR